jgi:LAO/AO transport system kinase
MEIADVFAVNKADHPEAGLMARALRQMLALRERGEEAWAVPVVKTSAVQGEGIAGLAEALEAHRAHLAPRWDATRAARLRRRVRRLVESGWRARFWTPARRRALDEALAALAAADRAPHRLAARLLAAEGTPNG